MNAAIEAVGLGKQYRVGKQSRWALSDCTLSIPSGHVVGLVGPNGAGKSTLLNLVTGLLQPTTGSVSVLGGRPAADASQLARVGFVAQDAPVYTALSVADHLRLGERMNQRWDAGYARHRVERLGLALDARAGRISGGQRAQLALTLAVAKQPDLLVLDEPAASLDPLARREFLDDLADAVAGSAGRDRPMSVVLSSHLVADLARVCDWLVVLSASRVQLSGSIEDLVAEHRTATGNPSADLEDLVLAGLTAGRANTRTSEETTS
ncbi:ABC transporter ATP-binding protein [Streptacidiphilus fuscans]|uniref:ABC transporter ATP-binding protein n=1 Tax=Streptacidiphilus fuscans TaxID=2789292 RepID=A0A931B0L3_9ACTN|nr:ABC transporter ATP-binding protein [Streptacidiphilus fuscans]MBF9066492.1 ABC transporter ATP-binding protein [Streptacidiphilus fuscans]